MNVAGSGRVGSSFSIRVAQNNVLGWRWTVEKEHDGFFEPPLRLAVRSRVRWPKGPR